MKLQGVVVIPDVANAHYGGEDVPDEVLHPKTDEVIAKTEYVRIDGWRGYWQVQPAPGWRRVGDGVHCGSYEDAPSGTSTRECEELLKGLVQKHGEVVLVLCGGSNVCAMQFDVLAKEQKKGRTGMRKNMMNVIAAFKMGQHCNEKSCHTNGNEVFSYAMKIAERRSDGKVYVYAGEAPTRTTASQLNALRLAFPNAEKME